jgi:hypothetical protein
LALDTGFGKRAMQALLGFGYLLTVLHEKHLGGHIEFTASALTAAASTTPAMAKNSHMRYRASFSGSSGASGSRAGMLAGLQKAIQECPSLSPGSFTPVRRSAAGPAGPAAAAAGLDSSQIPLAGNSSSSRGWQQQQQRQQAGPFAGASAGGGYSESSERTPLGSSNSSSFEVVWERINSLSPGGSGGRGAVHGLSLQLSLSAPLGTTCSSSLARVLEEELDQATAAAAAATDSAAADAVKKCSSVGRDSRRSTAAGAADAAAAAAAAVSLSKEPDMGRSGNMEKLLEEALQQLAEVDPAAVGLNTAAAAGGAATGQQLLQQSGGSAEGGTGRIESPFSSYQNLQLQEAELEAAVAGERCAERHSSSSVI